MNALPHGALALSSLEEQMLQPGVKGLPLTAPLRQGAIGVQGWNVLHGDTSYPVAVLKTAALQHNLVWMRDFCTRHGVQIAPHGKTTMCPQLFGAQLANGAWGITLANAVQVRVAHRFGVRRGPDANQLVARGFQELHGLSLPLVPVLRSGCYLTSDHGMYQRHIEALDAREGTAKGDGLRAALEIWSVVQSRPEPGLAILTMGKRDASHDAGLPLPLWHHRPGPGAAHALPDGCEIVKMNDQHAYLRLSEGAVRDMLAVGDLVGCGISHPCTTFDRWPLLLAVDDDYAVRFALNTFF
jgi:D-serine deaminase-like pyridoxal phosphate-dependent protein